MKFQSLTLTLFFLFLLSLTTFAQQPSGTPPVDDDDTLKISTTLIQADVTVIDKKGNVVTDLKPEEFEIYENGKKQSITNFSFITLVKPSGNTALQTNATTTTTNNKAAIPLPPVKLKAEQVRRTYALVVDDLGLSFQSISLVRQSLRKFVEQQVQSGDLVAIIRTGSGIGTLQSFTSDKRQLLAAIEKIRWNGQGRSGINGFPPIAQTTDQEKMQVIDEEKPQRTDGMEKTETLTERLEESRNENFSIGTLGALNYIIRGMRELPGRKSLLLFSEGFALTSGGTAEEKGLVRQNRIFDTMRILADLANRSSVIIYPLDPRGLQVPSGLTAEDNTWDPKFKDGFFGGGVSAELDNRNSRFVESQTSLRFLAAETGGISYLNQNTLEDGLEQAVTDQSSYYLLGYQPDDETFDPKKNKFNKLEIKVARPGVKVRYRSGFFGVSDEKIQTVVQTPQQKLAAALTSPFGATGVNLNLYPVFQNDAKLGDLVQALVYIDAKDLQFTKISENKKRAVFDIVATTYGDNGNPVEKFSKTYTLEVPEKVYQNMLTNGFVYTLTVPIKKTGAYQFRIAVRDTSSDKVGSASQFIEVPDIKKRLVLSNLVLDNFTPSEWQKVKLGGNRDESTRSVLLDATIRQFKRGTILRYDYVIYNPKQSSQIETQLRLIKDGKVVYEEQATKVDLNGQADLLRLSAAGAVSLGKNLEIGNYVLQIIAMDKTNAKKFATQYVEFEIVE